MKAKIVSRSAAAIVIAGALSAAYIAGHHNVNPEIIVPARADTPAAATLPAQIPANPGIPDFSGLVEAYGKAVVNISARSAAKPITQDGSQLPFSPNDPFYQFFKPFLPDLAPRAQGPRISLGSGFIISPDGLILTNAHVVAGASVVTVKLTDRREYRAKIIGSDKQTDTALLKIDAKNLPTVKIGNPDQSKVGQWVVAIGSPFGFDNTVTQGIISAKARSLPDETYIPFIQTDVPVNPGNSGGPLFNMNGEVIGINTMIYSQTGGFQGLAFAVPINVAMHVKDQLLKTGHVQRGRLGVTIQPVNQSLAKSFGLSDPQGALVSSVVKGSPAAKAGLKPGDVILQVNNQTIQDAHDLPALIAEMQPGTRVQLKLWRNGATKNVDATLDKLSANDSGTNVSSDNTQNKLGLVLRVPTPKEREDYSLSQGLMVQSVTGAALSAGIQPGDVLLAIDGQPVSTPRQVKERVARAIREHSNVVALLIQRGDTQIFVPVDIS